MSAFFDMGGYAAFVWPAYGATFIAIGALIWRSFAARKAARRLLAALDKAKTGETA